MEDRNITFEAESVESRSKKRGSAFDELLTRLGNYEIERWGVSSNPYMTTVGDLEVRLFSDTMCVTDNKGFFEYYSSEETKNLYMKVKDNIRTKRREKAEEILWKALDNESKRG